jgi:hypothetical protein
MADSKNDGGGLMRTEPTGAQLLASASRLLREELLELLPAERRHHALMILNAMSIASRQLDHGSAPERSELDALYQLLGSSSPPPCRDQESLQSELLRLNHQLAASLREGCADPEQPGRLALFQHLRVTTHQRLLESNPKYLK